MAKGLTGEEFLAKAVQRHGETYDYSDVVYKNYVTHVAIKCKSHGTFTQKPSSHLFGGGCPVCAKSDRVKDRLGTSESFITSALIKFGEKYTYERVNYVNSRAPVIVTCVNHGNFLVTPNSFLTGHIGCSTCSGSKLSLESFTARAKIVHGDRYRYDRSKIAGYHGLATITCQEHGDFEQTPNNHLQGKGCPKCIGKMVSDNRTFSEASSVIHSGKYGYDLVEYLTSLRKVKIMCGKHGVFEQTPANHLNGNGCPKCVSKVSKPEIELFDFISDMFPDAIQSVRSIISPFELDIVIPSKMIAIEYNGLYYHSDRLEGRKDDSHYQKSLLSQKAGYRLIHVWEDDWMGKRQVVEKTLGHILGKSKTSIGARSCSVVKQKHADVRGFFTSNHLQGVSSRGVAYSLQAKNNTVASMLFSPVSSERGTPADGRRFELIRYATSAAVAGGATRLMAAFLKDSPECVEVISYSDNDWFDGGMYEKLGFKHVADVAPDYKVVDGGIRKHKTGYKLSELEKRFGKNFNPLLSERENCRNNGLFRVYGSGLKKWVWTRA